MTSGVASAITSPGRANDREIAFYYTVGNWGVQFAAMGGHVYREAMRQGLGMQLPPEWFLQSNASRLRSIAIRNSRGAGRGPCATQYSLQEAVRSRRQRYVLGRRNARIGVVVHGIEQTERIVVLFHEFPA
jgi:hypothetical protein